MDLAQCKDACAQLGGCREVNMANNNCCWPAKSHCDGDDRPNDDKYVVTDGCELVPPSLPPSPAPSPSPRDGDDDDDGDDDSSNESNNDSSNESNNDSSNGSSNNDDDGNNDDDSNNDGSFDSLPVQQGLRPLLQAMASLIKNKVSAQE